VRVRPGAVAAGCGRVRCVAGVVLALCVSAVWAQDFGFRRRMAPRITAEKTPYDGRFTFARLRHGAEFGREPPWAHDYPRAERNFTHILKEITLVDPNTQASTVLTQDDPDLFTSPILYVSEPGYWTMTDDELLGMQNYISKGGFIIFDDFRGEHWFNFEEQVRRMIPGARLMEIDPNHPVFNAFFSINTSETQGCMARHRFRGCSRTTTPRNGCCWWPTTITIWESSGSFRIPDSSPWISRTTHISTGSTTSSTP
jgi:hypothetical protein